MIFKKIKYAFLAAMLLPGGIAFASSSPSSVLMTVDGHPVSLAEFEYYYAKDNPSGAEQRMGIKEYLQRFVDYRLKVQAAKDAGIDVNLECMAGGNIGSAQEARAYERYKISQQRITGKGGAVKTAQILVRMDQMATRAAQERAREKADSIRRALRGGADFAELAHRCSDDAASSLQGGVLPWIERGQTVKAFEDTAFSMRVGTVSEPILSEFGYHVIRLDDKWDAVPYDALKTDILRRMESGFIRERIVENSADTVAFKSRPVVGEEAEWKGEESELRDALLLNAISDREVWRKAASNKEGLRTFFAQNKKRRRYKGKEPDAAVLADYQDYLERQWLTALKARYLVKVDLAVLATVDKH